MSPGYEVSAVANEFDRFGMERLTEAECLRLLASVPVGRMVFHIGGLPAVRLVNFSVDDSSIVFLTAPGEKTQVAARGDVVAFEVDEYDVERHLGWTVTVIGHASLVTDAADLRQLRRMRIPQWAPGDRRQLVRIDIESIEGRRLLPWAQRPSALTS